MLYLTDTKTGKNYLPPLDKSRSLTPSKALKNGLWLINFPLFIIFSISIILGFYFAIHFFENENIWGGILIGIGGFVIGFILTNIYYYAYALNKWKYDAFSRVINPYMLYESAIDSSLLWAENSWGAKLSKKFEITSPEQKIFWDIIYYDYILPRRSRKLIDSPDLPTSWEVKYRETSINDKELWAAIFIMILSILLGIVSIPSLLESKFEGIHLLVLGGIGYSIWEFVLWNIKRDQFSEYKDKYVFSISNDGIKIGYPKKQLIKWSKNLSYRFYTREESEDDYRLIFEITNNLITLEYEMRDLDCDQNTLEYYLIMFDKTRQEKNKIK